MDVSLAARSPLFAGATEEEVQAMMSCLGATSRRFKKGAYVFRMGEKITSLGLVLSGGVRIETVDAWGNVTVLSHAGPGAVFGEAYACAPDEPLLVNAVATQDSEVLFLEAARIARTCPSSCAHHARIVMNLLSVLARKNVQFSQRSLHTAPKSIRGKVLAYLSSQASLAGSASFTIPFNRQELADYLGVDRSALSNELSKMQKDGLIVTDRSHFVLKGLEQPGA